MLISGSEIFGFISLNGYSIIARDKANTLFKRIFSAAFYCYLLHWYVSFDANDK